METLFQDLRYGIRTLLKNPSFAFVAAMTLALGIGASAAIFSVINAVVIRPLPYKDSDRIMLVEEKHELAGHSLNLTYASYLDLAARSESLESVSAYRTWNFKLTDAGEPEQVSGALVTYDMFTSLGATPAMGRSFSPEEDRPGNDKVVVLSYGLWHRRFNAEANVLGRIIKINDADCAVIGVMPRGFQFPDQSELWTPLAPGGSLSANRRSHLLTVIGRLKESATRSQAQAEMDSIAKQIDEQNPGVDSALGLSVIGLQQRMAAPALPALSVLLGAVGLVLLIACVNVANLMLARAARREQEIAIRAALGASRLRLIRQLMTESLLLAIVGGAAGAALAWLCVKLIIILSPGNIPRLGEASVDWRVLVFALSISLFTGILFGVAPALQSSRASLGQSLKDAARGSSGAGRKRLRNFLVVSEIALALVLLIGAGLLLNSFKKLLDVKPGFDPAGTLTMQLFLSGPRYAEDYQKTAFLKEALERIRSVPGAVSAGLVNSLPIAGGVATDFEIAGRPAPAAGQEPLADIRIIDTDYFRAMRIPLQRGRWFDERDTSQSQKVMAINEAMARRHWPDEDPLGKRVTMKDWGEPLTGEIVGIVGDVKANGLESESRPMIYWPYTQFPSSFNRIVIRAEGDQSSVIAAVKREVQAIDSEQPISDIRTMDEVLSSAAAGRRFNLALLGGFAIAALALAAAGVYGVASYMVAQRTREIGIRMALGAERRNIVLLIMKQSAGLTAAGIVVGLAGAIALTRLMSSLLFEVSPTDPLTFASVSLMLAGVALGASFAPARRAANVDPMIALRSE
jgi:putative ABC transport system permease protein